MVIVTLSEVSKCKAYFRAFCSETQSSCFMASTLEPNSTLYSSPSCLLFIFTPEFSTPNHPSDSFTPTPYVLLLLPSLMPNLLNHLSLFPDSCGFCRNTHMAFSTPNPSMLRSSPILSPKTNFWLQNLSRRIVIWVMWAMPAMCLINFPSQKPFYVMPWLVGI